MGLSERELGEIEERAKLGLSAVLNGEDAGAACYEFVRDDFPSVMVEIKRLRGTRLQVLRERDAMFRRAGYWKGKHDHLRQRVRELLHVLPERLPDAAASYRLILAALVAPISEAMDTEAEPVVESADVD